MEDTAEVNCCRPEFWAYLTICGILVSVAGITSGLALGLLSFSHVDLEVLIKAGKPQNKKYAQRILPIVKNQHLLLCTLLVVKTLATEALPIFLDNILPPWGAILMSVIFILAFAEIIPQAVCARHGLSLGAHFSPIVRLLLLVCYPVAFPISKLLDWLLGKGHSALLRRAELKTLVDLHADEAGKGGDLSQHETTIISGALDLTQKAAKDAMTPLSDTFCLDINSKLDIDTMGLIMNEGHSRIPIYSGTRKNIMGIILVKNLIFCRPEDETPIKNMSIRKIPKVYEDWPLYSIMSQFKKGHSHMAIVVKSKIKDVKITVDDEQGQPQPPFLHDTADRNSIPTQITEGIATPHDQTASVSIRTNTSSFDFSDKVMTEQEKELYWKGDQHVDDEVTGIITMEDVMEELLQEEILDETDEYIAVHDNIRIRLPSSRTSSGSFGRVASSSHRHHRTYPNPDPSPLSL
ncbi:hypothetical protein M5689_017910 [Euphorbia peplus]|nr:hypothetical protein M5689_017910 [Euphorbia peplus]